MSNKTGKLGSHLYDYLLSVSPREPAILTRLSQKAAQRPIGNMQISPDQEQFIALLVKLIGAKKILEIGTLIGYSALWMALALPYRWELDHL